MQNSTLLWVRGVAVLVAVSFAACGEHLDLLGDLNHDSSGGEASAGDDSSGRASGGGGAAGGNSPRAGSGALGGSAEQAGATEAGATGSPPPALNYQYTAMWTAQPIAYATKPGKLEYTKVLLHDRFLAESCTIADYNGDGLPDVSSGRRWYEQAAPAREGAPPTFSEHVFRGGHDDLPRTGAEEELRLSLSDDQSDFAFDVDGDGDTDVINLSNPLADDAHNPSAQPAPQAHGSVFWYENPGGKQASEAWTPHAIAFGQRAEQHGFADLDGDGRPEIFGASDSASAWGYYQMDPQAPREPWSFHAVTAPSSVPVYGVVHGGGFGDINADGQLDLLERNGAWLDVLATSPSSTPCPGQDCGVVPLAIGFNPRERTMGPAQIYAADLDGDGDADLVAADYCHGEGLSWYEQTPGNVFVPHRFLGSPAEALKFGAYFSEPHALAIADLDGDGVPDVLTGKTHYALGTGLGTIDPEGAPVSYVFRTRRSVPDADGSPLSFEPQLIDDQLGVGYQIGVGHLNDDGILDICVASKLGLAVFLGN